MTLTPPPLTPPSADGPIRIGFLVPLSGPNAAVGKALLDAAQLALFDLGEDRITLLPRDTEAGPDGTRNAALQVLTEGAELILGPLLGSGVPTVAALARDRGVNLISFSTDRSVAGPGAYLIGFTPEEQVDRVVAHARARGLARFAALAPDNAYGAIAVAALRRAVERHGGEVVKTDTYPPDAADLTPVVRRFAAVEARRAALAQQRRQLEGRDDEISRQALRRLEGVDAVGDVGFDALLLPEGGARLRALAPLLPYFDVDPNRVRFLGTGLWDDPTIGSEPALVGGWFASPPPDSANDFAQRFNSVYGQRPPRIAVLAYDAIALAVVLAKEGRGPGERRYDARALGNANGFAGFAGLFRFGAEGVAEHGLAVLEVQPRGLRVIAPAPQTFGAPGN